MGGVPGAMWGGGPFSHWRKQKCRVFQTRKFSKNVKKAMKNYNFLKIFKEILRFFENFVENFTKI